MDDDDLGNDDEFQQKRFQFSDPELMVFNTITSHFDLGDANLSEIIDSGIIPKFLDCYPSFPEEEKRSIDSLFLILINQPREFFLTLYFTQPSFFHVLETMLQENYSTALMIIDSLLQKTNGIIDVVIYFLQGIERLHPSRGGSLNQHMLKNYD